VDNDPIAAIISWFWI